MTDSKYISIKGARISNLKSIDVDIPRNKLVVITGPSGSGKSSLTSDAFYVEGQRRHVESLSSYARQFLGRMSKPECDLIEGVLPIIVTEQRVNSRSPRFTVGTSTEIYRCLRPLHARVDKTYSPVSGEKVRRHSIEGIVNCMLSYPEGTRYTMLAQIFLHDGHTLEQQLRVDQKQGFNCLEMDGEIVCIDEYAVGKDDVVYLLADRMTIATTKDVVNRLIDSAKTTIYEGNGMYMLRFHRSDGSAQPHTFSTKSEADDIIFEEPNDQMFSFNLPIGACLVCEGFGKVIDIDEHLVVSDHSLSVYDGVIVCWRGEKTDEWREELIHNTEKFNFPIFTPYYELTDEQRRVLWKGDQCFHGISDFFKMLEENQYEIQYRVMSARYRGKTFCPKCHGTRLKPEAGYVRVGGRNISELVDLPITELQKFLDSPELNKHDQVVVRRILTEVNSRIHFLIDMGLGYLTLSRLSNSLSGGESQRISLATSLESSLVGSLYILDEPSIGLHSRDIDRLIHVLRQLQQLGDAVMVVEHDREIIHTAGCIIGTDSNTGRLGRQVVRQGDMKDLQKDSNSYTVKYLLGEGNISVPEHRHPWNNCIEIKGAHENNLKGVDVCFPPNVMTVVTGASGSGKSTLIRDIFYRALRRELDEYTGRPDESASIGGDLRNLRNMEPADQNPIGKSSRSSPVTYIKAYNEIRKLWAGQPSTKQMGYTTDYFDFNNEGGRYKECRGDGTVTVEMQLMTGLVLERESCHGRRFKADTPETKFRDKNIYDVLEMTVNQTIEFFTEREQKKIVKKLIPLQDIGLGYIELRQSSSTLSGGEDQRVRLAYYLSQEKADLVLFIFDKPTTGLRFHDIHELLDAFSALVRRGHFIAIIEHNTDVIKCADYVISLKPEGGDKGGSIVVVRTLEEVAAYVVSCTGQFLQEKLNTLQLKLAREFQIGLKEPPLV